MKEPEKIADVWARAINPLNGLTQRHIDNMLQTARMGNDAMLQIAYGLVEKTTPIFGICID